MSAKQTKGFPFSEEKVASEGRRKGQHTSFSSSCFNNISSVDMLMPLGTYFVPIDKVSKALFFGCYPSESSFADATLEAL